MDALATSRRDSENDKKSDLAKKSLFERLEQYKKEMERSAVPIDGDEPPEKKGLQK